MATFQQAPVVGCRRVENGAAGAHAKVYFTKHIDAEHLIRLYERINESIYGKTAIKLHTGEQHGPNILPRDMVQAFQAQVPDSAIVETNTLYQGDRYTTELHRKTLEVNGWTFCPVDIMDEEGTVMLPVRGGKHFKEVSMGGHIVNYDSMIVLTHFKGHAMGGFGGSMKNIAIGCADGREGKAQVHGVDVDHQPEDWNAWPGKELLMENMAESAKATIDFFGKHIVFINVMRRPRRCGTDHSGYRHRRVHGYPRHRSGLRGYGVQPGKQSRSGGAHGEPPRPPSAHGHARTEDGQRQVRAHLH